MKNSQPISATKHRRCWHSPPSIATPLQHLKCTNKKNITPATEILLTGQPKIGNFLTSRAPRRSKLTARLRSVWLKANIKKDRVRNMEARSNVWMIKWPKPYRWSNPWKERCSSQPASRHRFVGKKHDAIQSVIEKIFLYIITFQYDFYKWHWGTNQITMVIWSKLITYSCCVWVPV